MLSSLNVPANGVIQNGLAIFPGLSNELV